MDYLLTVIKNNKIAISLIIFLGLYNLWKKYQKIPLKRDFNYWIETFKKLPISNPTKIKKEFEICKFKEPQQILKHFDNKIKRGSNNSKCIMGYFYHYGIIVNKNEKISLKYFLDSKDYKYSQFFLKKIFENGLGVKRDFGESLKYLILAAENEHDEAQNMLGCLYFKPSENYTDLVSQDDEKAYEWFIRSSENGNSNALTNLGILHEKHEEFEKAVKFYEKSAFQGDKEGLFRLGLCYKNGTGVAKNIPYCYKVFIKAIDFGDSQSMVHVGELYEKGQVKGKPNQEKAFEWYKQAAKKNDPNGLLSLGRCHEQGIGTRKSQKEASTQYAKALLLDPKIEYESSLFKSLKNEK
eukprot:gene7865-12335_t